MSRAAEIVFDQVTKRYAGRDVAAVKDLSLEIPAGTFCILVGPSGRLEGVLGASLCVMALSAGVFVFLVSVQRLVTPRGFE